jgi:hypothetical protein
MPERCRNQNRQGFDSVGRVTLKVTLPTALYH